MKPVLDRTGTGGAGTPAAISSRQWFRARWSQYGDAAVAFAVRVSSAGLVLVLHVFLARHMSLADYGTFVTVSTWLLVAGSFCVIGFSESSLRFLPRYSVRDRWDYVEGFFRYGFLLTAIASVGAAVVAVSVAWILPNTQTTQILIVLVAIGMPFMTADYYLEGVSRAFGWFKLATVPTYIAQPILIVGILWLVSSSGHDLNAVWASGVMIAVMACLSIYKAIAARIRLARLSRRVRSRERTSLWLRASLPLMVVYGLDELLLYADILLLGMLAGADDVGIYFAAARSLAIANFVYYAFTLVASRKFSISNASRDHALLQSQLRDSSRMTFLLTCPAVFLTLLAGYPMLLLFGESFTAGYPAMVILGAGLIARAAVGQAADLLAILGYAKENILISVGALVANVVLSIALIPLLGITGAALATALTMAGRALALAVVVKREAGLSVLAFDWPPRGKAIAVRTD